MCEYLMILYRVQGGGKPRPYHTRNRSVDQSPSCGGITTTFAIDSNSQLVYSSIKGVPLVLSVTVFSGKVPRQ